MMGFRFCIPLQREEGGKKQKKRERSKHLKRKYLHPNLLQRHHRIPHHISQAMELHPQYLSRPRVVKRVYCILREFSSLRRNLRRPVWRRLPSRIRNLLIAIIPRRNEEPFPACLFAFRSADMRERCVSHVGPEVETRGDDLVGHFALEHVADALVGGVEGFEGLEGRVDGAKDHWGVDLRVKLASLAALNFEGIGSPFCALTVARVKFGFSFSTKSQAAFSAKVLDAR